jgi:hypothetical protein
VKVSELSGGELDLWVSRAENRKLDMLYMPSTDWAVGGPIIERERIDIQHGGWEWGAWRGSNPFWSPIGEAFGQTPLVAAMRAYVVGKFGEEVSD